MSANLLELAKQGDFEKLKEHIEKNALANFALSKDPSDHRVKSTFIEYQNYPKATEAIILAAKYGHHEVVKYFLDRANANPEEENNQNILLALAQATERQDIEAIKILLPHYNNKASIISALIKSLAFKDKTIFQLFLSQKDVLDQELMVKLAFYACNNDDKDMLIILVKNGLDIDVKNQDGDTLLESVIKENKKNMVGFLLENKIKLTGNELMLVARHSGSNPNSVEMCKMLFEARGKELNINKSDNMVTPLLSAIQNRNIELAVLLLDLGAHLFVQPIAKEGYSILDFVFEIGSKKLLDKVKQKISQHSIDKNNDENSKFLEFVEKSNLVRDAGHILGITSDNYANIQSPMDDSLMSIKYEGSMRYRSIASLSNLLKKYSDLNSAQLSPDSQKYFSEVLKTVNRTMNLEPYESNSEKMNLVVSGWAEHVIALVFYNNDYVVANRGGGKKEFETGVNIHRLDAAQKNNLNNQFLSDISNPDFQYSKEVILNKIDGLITDREKGLALKSKDQMHGNCSFVNPKASIQAMLFLLKKQDLMKLSVEISADAEKIINKKALEFAQIEYKKFTNFIRNYFLDKVVRDFKYPKNAEFRKINKEILVLYIQQHHGKKVRSEEKRGKELERIYRILYSLDLDSRKELIEIREGQTPKAIGGSELLCAAAEFASPELVQLLIDTGVGINERNAAGDTPLQAAIKKNRPEIVKLLLGNGANPAQIDSRTGFSNLHLASQFGHVAIVNLLIPKLSKEELNRVGPGGMTALHMASQRGHTEIVSTLLPILKKEEINQSTPGGWTAAMLAANNDHIGVLTVLNSNENVDINKVGPNNSTALMIAAAMGRKPSVKVLADNPKVDLSKKTPQGKTAVELAEMYKHPGIVEYLKEIASKRARASELQSREPSKEWTPSYGASKAEKQPPSTPQSVKPKKPDL